MSRVITILTSLGVGYNVAKREVMRSFSDPYMKAALKRLPLATRMEELLRLYEALAQKSELPQIDEVTELDEAEFLAHYYYRNRAVVIRKGAIEWPAVKQWNMDFLRENHGSDLIEFMRGKRYTEASERVVSTLTAFIDTIRMHDIKNDEYLVATNFAFKSPLRARLQDCMPLPFLRSIDVSDPSVARLWLGPRGTITPLHYDVKNVVFVQISGSKRFMMAPAYELYKLDAQTGSVFSNVDPVSIDHAAQRTASPVSWITLDIEPGDILFIPIGWWHWVYALSESISLNFADFPIQGSVDKWLYL